MISSISNIMSINRFEKITQYFHCNDNLRNVHHGNENSRNVQSSHQNYDKLNKVRPVMESVLKKCCQIPPEEVHCIDD